jgi:hypothetical protein
MRCRHLDDATNLARLLEVGKAVLSSGSGTASAACTVITGPMYAKV